MEIPPNHFSGGHFVSAEWGESTWYADHQWAYCTGPDGDDDDNDNDDSDE
jgi:hypothetical protein